MNTKSKGRVLIVDDEASIRNSMSMLLKSAGYDICSAEDGFEALLQLGTEISQVIISDLNMPKCLDSSFSL